MSDIMKIFWVDIIGVKDEERKELITTALESGVDAVVVPEDYTKKVKELGKIKTVAPDGDLKPGKEVVIVEINFKGDEKVAVKVSKKVEYLIIKCGNWKVIPLENLIAEISASCKLIVEVANSEEAEIALGALEKGADGVLLATDNPNEIKKTKEVIDRMSLGKVELVLAKVTKVKSVKMGHRVCVDACTLMTSGQGMLVGNYSKGLFLVHSESIENPYVAARPFRVNAGAVHCYVMVPDGRTKYLSELESGSDILIVDCDGNVQIASVGRNKTEKRPLILVEAEYEGEKISVILQNAETIKLVGKDGKTISVVKLKQGDQVLVHIIGKGTGRHMGSLIEETIEEK